MVSKGLCEYLQLQYPVKYHWEKPHFTALGVQFLEDSVGKDTLHFPPRAWTKEDTASLGCSHLPSVSSVLIPSQRDLMMWSDQKASFVPRVL